MNKLLLNLVLAILVLGCSPKQKTVSISSKNVAAQAVKLDGKGWENRHQTILDRLNPNAEMILVGNSIFHTLDKDDRTKVWDKYLNQYHTINMGISGDRTENVIWRLENGSLEKINPKVAVVLIGTNNTDGNHYLNITQPKELSEGIWKICSIILDKLPNTQIVLMGILPYGNKPNHRDIINKETNSIISNFPEINPKIHYVDIGSHYYTEEGRVNSKLMPDYLHPNAEGHMIMFEALKDEIQKAMTQ